MAKIINSIDTPNMPWEDRPADCDRPIWRYSKNPITKRPFRGEIDRVFNSSLVPFNGGFVGVFRADTFENKSYLYVGYSKDGIKIELEDEPIKFVDNKGEVIPEVGCNYDPRIIKIEDKYYVVYCAHEFGVYPAIAETTDFKTFVKYHNPLAPNSRNAVLFPRKIGNKYKILTRPSDMGHTKFGNIYISDSEDLHYWGNAKLLLNNHYAGWNFTKVGGGPAPIETNEGWLVFIHGVTTTCSGFVYSMGAIILDRENPSKILYKCQNALMMPTELYECNGFVPNVIFPTSTLVDSKTGRIAIYYGAADAYTALAFTDVTTIVEHIKKYSKN